MPEYLSTDVDTFLTGGGLLDDVDAKITQARTVMFDYNGTAAAVPALQLTLDVDGEPHVEHYKAGDAAAFAPTEDGLGFKAVGKRTALHQNSKAAMLMRDMVNVGAPADFIRPPYSNMEGAVFHFARVVLPKMPNATSQKDNTILTVSALLSLPGESGMGSAGGVGEKATAALLSILGTAGGSVKKNQLPALIAKECPGDREVLTLAFSDDFLRAGPWTYQNGVISL
jgi:hypothetical protein